MRFSALAAAGMLALFGLSSAAQARGWDGYRGFGAKFGLVDPDHWDSTWTIGAYGEFGVAENVTINVGIDYWKTDEENHRWVDAELRDIAVGGFGRFIIPTSGSMHPFIGGGLALHMLDFDWGNVHDDDSEIGFDIGGGVIFGNVRDLGYIAELRMREVDDDWDADHMSVTFGVLRAM